MISRTTKKTREEKIRKQWWWFTSRSSAHILSAASSFGVLSLLIAHDPRGMVKKVNRETKLNVMFPNRIISHWNDIVGLVKNSNSVDNCEVQISGSGCKKRGTVLQKVNLVRCERLTFPLMIHGTEQNTLIKPTQCMQFEIVEQPMVSHFYNWVLHCGNKHHISETAFLKADHCSCITIVHAAPTSNFAFRTVVLNCRITGHPYLFLGSLKLQ